jgi:hypothetical protein
MIERLQRGIEPGVVIEQGRCTIYIERGAEFFRCASKIDLLTKKAAVAVVKRMHEEW